MEKSLYPYPEFFTTGITRIGMNAGTYRLNLSNRMPFTELKRAERKRHRDRKMYLL